MLLTQPQTSRFWREWQNIVRLHNWSRPEAESQRNALLARAGFPSLTLVDKLAGFDRVIAQLAAIKRPDDLAAQMRQTMMPRHRLLFAIGRLSSHLSAPATGLFYAAAIARDKFGVADLDALTEPQLRDLRNTLAARLSAHRRRQRLQQAA